MPTTPAVTNLLADAQAKIPQKKLIQLTNPEDPAATTVDTTLLQRACEDAALYFELRVAKDYDDTNPLHRQLALPGVEAFLRKYIDQTSSAVRDFFSQWDDQLQEANKARSFRLRKQQIFSSDTRNMDEDFFDKMRIL